MAITVNWLDEGKDAVVMAFIGEWTWRDFEDAVQEANALVNVASGNVAHISDFTRSTRVPGNAIANLRRLSADLGERRDATNCSIIVGANRAIMTLMRVFTTLYKEIVYVDTLAEARAFLAERQTT